MAVRAVKDKLKTSKSLPQVLSSCTLCNLVLGTEIGTRYRYIDDTPLVPMTEVGKANGTASTSSTAKTRSRPNNEYVLYSYGEPVAMSADGDASYFSTDILGSVRSVTDKYGAVQDDYSYDAFGSPYLGNLENDIGFGYCGKVYDVGTGLYDYGFRDYSPNNARFTTIDPIRDGSNWFSYVVNDPVNYVDLLGLSATDSKSGTKGAKNNTSDYTVLKFAEDVTVTMNGKEYKRGYMILAPQDKARGASDGQIGKNKATVKISAEDKKNQIIDYSMDEGGKLSITDAKSKIINGFNDLKKGLYNFAINLPLGIGTWVQKNIGDGQGKLDKSGEYKQAPSDWWEKAIKSVGLPDQWEENYKNDPVQKALQEKFLIKE